MLKAAVLSTLALSFSAGLAQADITGDWVTEPNKDGAWAEIAIRDCGNAICAKMIRGHGPGSQDGEQPELIENMVANGSDSYAGRVYAPDNEKWYIGKINVISDDKLKVSGCVAGGLLCRSSEWTRQ